MRWILAICVLIVSSSVVAQGGLCGDREDFLKQLEEKFSEVIEHVAITSRGALAEWTVAPSGSWSMLVTTPDGVTCIVASGDSWQNKLELEGIRA